MAIVVETGAGDNSAANAYANVAAFRAWASARDLPDTIPEADAKVEGLIIRAMDWLNGQEARWRGSRVTAIQPLAWPRQGVTIAGLPFPADAIPPSLVSAQHQLALEILRGVDLAPTVIRKDGALASKSIGSISKSWHAPGPADGVAPQLTAVELFLSGLVSESFGLRTIRV